MFILFPHVVPLMKRWIVIILNRVGVEGMVDWLPDCSGSASRQCVARPKIPLRNSRKAAQGGRLYQTGNTNIARLSFLLGLEPCVTVTQLLTTVFVKTVVCTLRSSWKTSLSPKSHSVGRISSCPRRLRSRCTNCWWNKVLCFQTTLSRGRCIASFFR